MEILFLIGRIVFGGYFIYNGYNHFMNLEQTAGYAGSKGVPNPKAATIITGTLLVLGGAGVLLGIYPQIALGLIALFLLPVTITMHRFWEEEGQSKATEQITFLKNFALLGATLALMAFPFPWPLSILS